MQKTASNQLPGCCRRAQRKAVLPYRGFPQPQQAGLPPVRTLPTASVHFVD